ncbi:MAG: HD domain-containing phosphohydrolase [Nitrospirota bacterium]
MEWLGPFQSRRREGSRRDTSLTTRLVGLIAVVVVATLSLTTWRIYVDRNRSLEDDLGQRLLSIVQTAALMIDGAAHEEIAAPEDATIPEFLELRSRLRLVQSANGLNSSIYTLRRLGNATEFVVMTDEMPYIGNRYQLRREMLPVFEQGRSTYTRLYVDDHGEWISAYAPIRDATGHVVGLLDLDYPADTFQTASRAYRNRLLAFSAFSLLIAGILGVMFARSVARPVRSLTNTMARVIETDNLDVTVQPTGTIREMNDLSRTFNILTRSLQHSREKVRTTQIVTIGKLASLAEKRDPETGEHLLRMADYTKILARQLHRTDPYQDTITEAWIDAIYEAAPLHDIGKVAIIDRVLLKPGKLTDEEFAIMKTHSGIGAAVLEGVDFLDIASQIAWSHHEKWDGTGYPRGLAGTAIPLPARIVALADVYDALTSRRVYKDAMTHEAARRIILDGRGKHFAPDVVEAFVDVEHEFLPVREQYADLSAQPKHEPYDRAA